MTCFSPSLWVLWTPVYEILVRTLHWAVSLSHWPHLLHPIWKGSFKSRKHRPQWWCLSHVGGWDSYGPTVIFVTCAVAVTLPKLANQSYVNKLINQSKYWVELSKQQWCEHSKIIIYSIYHSFQESLWYRLQVILLSNHSWTTSKFLEQISMWNSNINLRYLWCSQGKKVPLFHLFIRQVFLESNFGHLSSI